MLEEELSRQKGMYSEDPHPRLVCCHEGFFNGFEALGCPREENVGS